MAETSEPFFDEHTQDWHEDEDDLPCTWCGGEGLKENDDPLWHGDAVLINCEACHGTGLRKHQTVF